MDKTDKIVCAAIIAPFAGALLGGLYSAVFGFSFMFHTDYGIKGFVIGAVVSFAVVLAAEMVIAACAKFLWCIAKLFRFLTHYLSVKKSPRG